MKGQDWKILIGVFGLWGLGRGSPPYSVVVVPKENTLGLNMGDPRSCSPSQCTDIQAGGEVGDFINLRQFWTYISNGPWTSSIKLSSSFYGNIILNLNQGKDRHFNSFNSFFPQPNWWV